MGYKVPNSKNHKALLIFFPFFPTQNIFRETRCKIRKHKKNKLIWEIYKGKLDHLIVRMILIEKQIIPVEIDFRLIPEAEKTFALKMARVSLEM